MTCEQSPESSEGEGWIHCPPKGVSGIGSSKSHVPEGEITPPTPARECLKNTQMVNVSAAVGVEREGGNGRR